MRERGAAVRVQVRIDRLAAGNAGDAKPVGDGISELRIDHGPGYRVYFMQRGLVVIVLLCGGDKSKQDMISPQAQIRLPAYSMKYSCLSFLIEKFLANLPKYWFSLSR